MGSTYCRRHLTSIHMLILENLLNVRIYSFCPALFSRSWLKYFKVDLNSVLCFLTNKSIQESIQEILQKYNSVFSEVAEKFFGGFRCGVWLFLLLLLDIKIENR